MDEYDLFAKALGLQPPWLVKDVKFSIEEGRLDLWICFQKGARFACPSCGRQECQVHDTQERTWRHLNFFQYQSFIHANVPRTSCLECGVKLVEPTWSRPGSGFTLLFEMLILQLAREMSVAATAKIMGVHQDSIWRILGHYVEKARQRVDLSSLQVVGVDECSKEKGHDYLTIFSDLDKSRVIFVAESRKGQVVKEFRKDLQERKVNPQQIEQFCSDMWEPYLRGFDKEFPEASVTFDRYHVISLMNRVLDEVRREEQRNNSMLKHTRYIWLKNPQNLTSKQQRELNGLKGMDLKTVRAYHLKCSLSHFWELESPCYAEQYLKKWYFWATHSHLKPVIEVAKTIKSHWEGILRFIESRISNGVVEGLNSKIKTAAKRAYGFKKFKYYRTIIYLVAGKLEFDDSLPLPTRC